MLVALLATTTTTLGMLCDWGVVVQKTNLVHSECIGWNNLVESTMSPSMV